MLVTLPSPIPELQHAPLPPQSATSQGACPDSLLFCWFPFGLTFESIKEPGGVSGSVEEVLWESSDLLALNFNKSIDQELCPQIKCLIINATNYNVLIG
jgi:hypothetical protein